MDRHEHIGQGRIGRKGFRNLMTDPRLAEIPKFLETPKDDRLDFDRKNLATLRRLAVASPDNSRTPGRNTCISLRNVRPVTLKDDKAENTTCSRERFFVGTRKTDDGDAGGIAEEV